MPETNVPTSAPSASEIPAPRAAAVLSQRGEATRESLRSDALEAAERFVGYAKGLNGDHYIERGDLYQRDIDNDREQLGKLRDKALGLAEVLKDKELEQQVMGMIEESCYKIGAWAKRISDTEPVPPEMYMGRVQRLGLDRDQLLRGAEKLYDLAMELLDNPSYELKQMRLENASKLLKELSKQVGIWLMHDDKRKPPYVDVGLGAKELIGMLPICDWCTGFSEEKKDLASASYYRKVREDTVRRLNKVISSAVTRLERMVDGKMKTDQHLSYDDILGWTSYLTDRPTKANYQLRLVAMMDGYDLKGQIGRVDVDNPAKGPLRFGAVDTEPAKRYLRTVAFSWLNRLKDDDDFGKTPEEIVKLYFENGAGPLSFISHAEDAYYLAITACVDLQEYSRVVKLAEECYAKLMPVFEVLKRSEYSHILYDKYDPDKMKRTLAGIEEFKTLAEKYKEPSELQKKLQKAARSAG